jgi:hypothetical protein
LALRSFAALAAFDTLATTLNSRFVFWLLGMNFFIGHVEHRAVEFAAMTEEAAAVAAMWAAA